VVEAGIVRFAWQGCAAPVVLYSLPTGGHDWPGSTFSGAGTNQNIDATDTIWQFFASVAKSPAAS